MLQLLEIVPVPSGHAAGSPSLRPLRRRAAAGRAGQGAAFAAGNSAAG